MRASAMGCALVAATLCQAPRPGSAYVWAGLKRHQRHRHQSQECDTRLTTLARWSGRGASLVTEAAKGADHACEDASMVPGPNEVWCFAYGANMSPAVLSRRKVNPLRSFKAEVEDPDLVILFDHTDAYANIGPREKALRSTVAPYNGPAEGVLFLLTKDDFGKLDKSETGYHVRTVRVRRYCHTVDDDADDATSKNVTTVATEALTFRTNLDVRLKESLPPTSSYKNKLVTGAIHHNLSPGYIAWLKSLPSIDDSAKDFKLPPEYSYTPASYLAAPVMVSFAAVLFAAAARAWSL